MPRIAWAALLAGVVGGVVLAAGASPRQAIDGVIGLVREAGPVWYFLAMALLPVPLAWFTVPAGEAFAPQLTLPGVIAAGLAAVAVQVSLTYWLARYALRPPIARALGRRGHTIPAVTPANSWGAAWLVRLTPGPPMFLGSCLLALAEVPFRRYLVVSLLVALPWVCAGVLLGRGLLQGNIPLIGGGAGLAVAALIAARWWRRRRDRDATAGGKQSGTLP
jgi:uncharacterized membrane protein YdjX (TVP38/TMEM64 family)